MTVVANSVVAGSSAASTSVSGTVVDAGDSVDTLVFHALDDVAGVFSADVIVGTGSLTEARTSTIYCPNASGTYVSYGSGVPGEYYADGKWWLYCAPAMTNSITYSRDLTNAAWSKVGGVINSYDQTGMTGAANTAAYLEDNNGGGYEYISEALSITANSNTHVARWFIKKDADTSRFVGCFLDLGSLKAWFHLNTSTGATAAVSGNDASATIDVRDAGDWWEVLVSLTNDGTKTGTTIYCMPADATVIGTRSTAGTGSCIVGNVEFHDGSSASKTIAEIRGSSPIFTSGSSVTVNATDTTFDKTNSGTGTDPAAWYVEFLAFAAEADLVNANNTLIRHGAAAEVLFKYTRGNNFRTDPSNLSNATAGGTYTAEQTYQLGAAMAGFDGVGGDTAENRFNVDGTWGTKVTHADGATPNFSADLELFPIHSSSVALYRNLRRYAEADYAAAEATIDGLMP